MNITNITNDYVNITVNNYTDILNDYDNITFSNYDNCTNIESEDKNILYKFLLLSIPSSRLLIAIISLMIYTIIKPVKILNDNGVIFSPKSSSEM